MTTYTIYLGATPIANVSGTDYAYEVYRTTCELADLLCKSAFIIWDETGEKVSYYDPEEEEEL